MRRQFRKINIPSRPEAEQSEQNPTEPAPGSARLIRFDGDERAGEDVPAPVLAWRTDRHRRSASAPGPGAIAATGATAGTITRPTSRRRTRPRARPGSRLFDTAEVYGQGLSEQLLGRLAGADPAVLVATKFAAQPWRLGRRGVLLHALEESLRAVGATAGRALPDPLGPAGGQRPDLAGRPGGGVRPRVDRRRRRLQLRSPRGSRGAPRPGRSRACRWPPTRSSTAW